jgi:hypothetical protein
MSVNSVLSGFLPSYGPLSGNSSQNAKPGAGAKAFPEQTPPNPDTAQATGDELESTAQSASSTSSDSTDAGQFESTLEQTLRQGGATTASSASGSSTSSGGRSSAAIAAYQRISQYGNNEPSTSALLKRWNSIMQEGNDADGAAASFAKLLAQNETPGLESGVIDLTA